MRTWSMARAGTAALPEMVADWSVEQKSQLKHRVGMVVRPGAFAMGLLIRLQRGDMIPVAGSLALGIRGSFVKQWPNID
jgi:hypothetical protein